MSNLELERARAELKKIGADFALLSTIENVTYVSHWEVPIEFGASAAFNYSWPVAFFGVQDGASVLLAEAGHAAGAKAKCALDEIVGHVAFTHISQQDNKANFLNSVRDALKKAGLGSGKAKLAVEEKHLSVAVWRMLSAEFPGVEVVDATPALSAARRVKTDRELDLIRFAAEVNRVGHTELLRQCEQAGKNEHDMWGAVVTAMEKAAGHTLFVFGELVTGTRCSAVNYPGGPQNVVTRPGDLALMDMSPRVNGYWSDCTNTMVIGGVEPTKKQKLYGVAAREAFYAAIDKLRPGHLAHEAFDAAKATFERHGLEIGHYAGHQIGLAVNENPRLVPYEQTPVEAGMVFSIETGAYEGQGKEAGARMEKSIIVRESGPEVLCEFTWGF